MGVSAESADVRVEKAGTVKGRDATSSIEVAEELAPDLSADSPDSTDPALTADSEGGLSPDLSTDEYPLA